MRKLNQRGLINPLLIPLVISVLALIGVSVIAFMYYGNYVDQRDNVNQKISDAVEVANAKQKKELDAQFAEQEKLPNKVYTSPEIYGSVKLSYPKTWGAFVSDTGSSMDFYAHPNFVPSKGVNYALRMSVTDRTFAKEVQAYDAKVKKGDLTAVSITVSKTTGTRLDGLLQTDQAGSLVMFPLRDKTLKIWTENKDYQGDFENTLKNLSFVP